MAEALMFMFGEEMVSKVISLASDEITLAWNFEGELKNLEQSLKMVNALIYDASSNNKTQLGSVKVWLEELNDVAFNADVVLEEFAYKTLRCRVENRKRDKVLALFSPSKNPLVFRQKLAHKIRKVKASVDKIYNEGTKIGLTELVGHKDINVVIAERKNERLTHPYIDDDSKIVGRENDVLNIVKMLCDDDEDDVNLSVIAIRGLGGQGKTTLAQLVSKHEKVMKHFDEIIWVCVSDDFVVTTLLNEMVQSLTGRNSQLSNVQAIIDKELGPKLKDKRYLLVLDDVWNEEEEKWGRFRSALSGISGARSGSKIMVTTRSDKVASTMQASVNYQLNRLSDEESWTMFKQRAFADGGVVETEHLSVIGRKIVKMCMGLPLAIKVIGSLMYSKNSENDWLSVQNSQLWNLEDDTNRVIQTLKLSYDHLPFPIKRCFSFCSFYPKDTVIQKNELIRCWMALGLLQIPSGSDQVMEDVGEWHFKTLLSMSLLQDTNKDELGAIKSCKMHDIVHDLALTTTQTDYSALNSLALVSEHVNNPLVHLRVLVLNNYKIEPVDSIKKLKHLRYLDISKTKIRDMPSSCTKLYNLQTIKFNTLISVPKDFGNLINLRHLCVDDISWSGKCLLIGIERLTCLQTLPFFGVNRELGCHIKELESLNNLRGELIIFRLDDVKNCEEAKHAFLSEKPNLQRLRLCWGFPEEFWRSGYTFQEGDNNEYVLEGLKPHSNLKELAIENFKGSNFPRWMMVESQASQVLGNLVKFQLHKCDKCEGIPPLGHLQHLKVVEITKLSNVKEIGVEFYGSSSGSSNGGVSLFPVLRELILREMPKLERWSEAVQQSSVSKNVLFPCLEKLEISDCPSLKSFPTHFPSLTEFSISDIYNLLSLKELSRMQTSLTSLDLQSCRGSEFQSVLEEFLMRNNRSLRILRISSCHEFVCLPDNLVALEELSIADCENLTDIQYCLPSATYVYISKCSKLLGLPSLSQVFPVVAIFSIEYCNEMVAFPDIRSHTCLQRLKIEGLEKLTSVPELCKSLLYLKIIDCERLTSLELGKTLGGLTLRRCKALVSFPDFRYLRELCIEYTFSELEEGAPDHFPWPSSDIQCLQRLELGGWPKLKSLPHQIQHLTSLTYLELRNFDGVESLPDWLPNLISLKTLEIENCKNLKYFPSLEAMRRLTNLNDLTIVGCPLLEERFTKGIRPEWIKISHIPNININYKRIK